MTIQQLASQIPAHYRKEILLTNMISKAQAIAGDNTMFYLFTVWKSYIEPDIKADCNMCFARVLDNYKAMQETLIQLEKEANLLEA
jgi:hypothetical protein